MGFTFFEPKGCDGNCTKPANRKFWEQMIADASPGQITDQQRICVDCLNVNRANWVRVFCWFAFFGGIVFLGMILIGTLSTSPLGADLHYMLG